MQVTRYRIAGDPREIVLVAETRRILVDLARRRPGRAAVGGSDHIDIDIRAGIDARCADICPDNIDVTAIGSVADIHGHHRK